MTDGGDRNSGAAPNDSGPLSIYKRKPCHQFVRVALFISLFLPAIAGAHENGLKPCGIITKSITLKRDCLGPMIIGRDNITVDLKGHTIQPGDVEDVDSRGGVEIFDRRGITIKNGKINGYDYGLLVRGGGGHTFRNLDVKCEGAEEPENQVFIDGVDHTVAKRITVTPFFDRLPFRLIGRQSTIAQVKSNGYASSGAAIFGDDLVIAHNEFTSAFGDEAGYGLLFKGERSTIRRNKLTPDSPDPREGGLGVTGSSNVIKQNTIIGGATGLILSDNSIENVIRNNYVRSNPDAVYGAVDIRGGDNACDNTWKRNNIETDSEGDGPD